ncbi:MAG: hypothetical protein ABW095_07970 [Candidatus Thiodiazotropha sp.]
MFDKTLTIVALEVHQGTEYFHGQLQVGDDPSTLNLFYHADDLGGIFMTFDPALADETLLVTANPLSGDRIGNCQVAGEELVETPATGEIKALLIENFSLDNPQLQDEQRMEWEGKHYARGVGLVSEADGLGGSCVLHAFHLQNP